MFNISSEKIYRTEQTKTRNQNGRRRPLSQNGYLRLVNTPIRREYTVMLLFITVDAIKIVKADVLRHVSMKCYIKRVYATSGENRSRPCSNRSGVCGTRNGRKTFIPTIACTSIRNGFPFENKTRLTTRTAFNGRSSVFSASRRSSSSVRGR